MSGHFQPLKSSRVLRKIKEITKPTGEPVIINRNPRNLERLRIALKPNGYFLEKPGRSFWHKLELTVSGRYATAEVRHFQNGPVIGASTSEWAIKKHLYKTCDTPAFVNLARVFAMRCLQSGITEMACNIDAVPGGKIDKFLRTLEENGLKLQEPERYVAPLPWDAVRHEKPWEVVEDVLQSEQQPKKNVSNKKE
ncbi:39S ribosomal protein L18, mitochondrial [Anastrepha obliqua]|uniref:39S ribosomal protein L18, mitochondrial n=1 Tax=Anastrepha obliqua TaxID=95512 RepID=UPI00240A5D24|nr:39S ribosomal protein L18, mitochondrial [Anastrepha obliqua]